MFELLLYLDSEYISYDLDSENDTNIVNINDYNLDMQITEIGDTFEIYENIFLCKNITNLDIDEVKDIIGAIKILGGIL